MNTSINCDTHTKKTSSISQPGSRASAEIRFSVGRFSTVPNRPTKILIVYELICEYKVYILLVKIVSKIVFSN